MVQWGQVKVELGESIIYVIGSDGYQLCSIDTAYFLRGDFRISGRLHRQSIFLLIYTNIIFC